MRGILMSNDKTNSKRLYEDASLLLAFAEALMAVNVKQTIWELRLYGLKRLQSQLTYYEDLGYDKSLLAAISKKKSQLILQISSQTELDKVIRPRVPYFDGNRFIPDSYNIPEEELICWCETSLRAPLNEYCQHRYMEVFRQVFPERGKEIDMRENL